MHSVVALQGAGSASLVGNRRSADAASDSRELAVGIGQVTGGVAG